MVRTHSEPEPDPMELNLVVRCQVQHTPPNLTSVRFEVLSFRSKNRTEPDHGSTSSDVIMDWLFYQAANLVVVSPFPLQDNKETS